MMARTVIDSSYVAIAAIALAITACKPPGGSASDPMQNSYSFSEIRNLSSYVQYGTAGDPQVRRSAQQNLPTIVALYEQSLKTFESTYGANVLSEIDLAAFKACRTALADTANFSKQGQRPASDVESHGRELQRQLNACRSTAKTWLTSTKTATLGNNLKRMTAGAMLVLANAMVAEGAELPGYMVGQEARALLDIDKR